MSLVKVVLALLLALPFVSGCARYESLHIGDIPPQVVLSDLEGKRITVPGDLKGQVVLIRFWSATCPRCTKEMINALESLYQKYREKGFVVLSVNVNPLNEVSEKFRQADKVSFPVLLDPDLSVAKRYGAKVLPTTFILDREGVVKEKMLGETGVEMFEPLVKQLL
ncbi:MAG: TlpA disulfide reductase family protein [Nitrospirae bacterium]|nr:TlpA disulfide reductase family protein [Nitrospirota bacterium]